MYTKKIFGKEIKLKVIYENNFYDFWKNKNNSIDLQDTNNPILFDKVDAYFELMSEADWRKIKAEPITITRSKYILTCNFEEENSANNNIGNILEISKNNKIKYISIKETYTDYLLKKLKIPENRIFYLPDSSKVGVLRSLYYKKEKYCAFSEMINAIKYIYEGKIYFIADLPEERDLAWWVKKDSPEITKFVKDFVEYLDNFGGLNKIFMTLYGVNLNFYELLFRENECN